VTYGDLHVKLVCAEVHHDRQHRHRRDGDAPGEEEEEDQTAQEETHNHGDEHVQLPGMRYKCHIILYLDENTLPSTLRSHIVLLLCTNLINVKVPCKLSLS